MKFKFLITLEFIGLPFVITADFIYTVNILSSRQASSASVIGEYCGRTNTLGRFVDASAGSIRCGPQTGGLFS